MRFTILFFFLIFSSLLSLHSQNKNPGAYFMNRMPEGDSVIYYQCHVEEAGMSLTTASGQTLNALPQKCSITEKFVVIKRDSVFLLRYYTSSMTVLPNRKFSGLKIRERAYWNFKFEKQVTLTSAQVKLLQALESKGHEATEYDFVISKYTTNQLIVKFKKDFRQLVIDGGFVVSQLLNLAG